MFWLRHLNSSSVHNYQADVYIDTACSHGSEQKETSPICTLHRAVGEKILFRVHLLPHCCFLVLIVAVGSPGSHHSWSEWMRRPRERSGSSALHQDQVYSEIQLVQKATPQAALRGPLPLTNFGANIADAIIHFHANSCILQPQNWVHICRMCLSECKNNSCNVLLPCSD